MKLKRLLTLIACICAGITCASALDYEYVGGNNVQVSLVSGIGTNAYYLMSGNRNWKGTLEGSEFPGKYYAGINAVDSANNSCVMNFININDSSFYIFFPAIEGGKYITRPTAGETEAKLTSSVDNAGTFVVKASVNIGAKFIISITLDSGTTLFLTDGGKDKTMGYISTFEDDGKADWTVYRADVKRALQYPMLLTSVDGLPAAGSTKLLGSYTWKSPVYYSQEAVSSFRLTVMESAPGSCYNVKYNQGYAFFALSGLTVYGKEGAKLELNENSFTTNASENTANGTAPLCDNNLSTFFHSCWNEHTGPIAAEHYLEITLPEPQNEFSFEMFVRSNGKNFPSRIGITAGGVDYNPYEAYQFVLGDKADVSQVKENELYVMRSDCDGAVEYPAYDKTSRARLNPNADCVFTLVSNGTETFSIKNVLTGKYVAAPAGDAGVTFVSQIADAGKFSFGSDGKIVSDNGYHLYLRYETLAAKADTAIVWELYHASLSNVPFLAELQQGINDARDILNKYGDQFKSSQDGEKEALEDAIAEAQKQLANPTGNASNILTTLESLTKKEASLRCVELLYLCDSINNILLEETFENKAGCYPPASYTELQKMMNDGQMFVDKAQYSTIKEVENYIANVKSYLSSFWKSLIEITTLPLHLTTADGLPGTLVSNGKQYQYKSNFLFFKEAITRLRLTVKNTNTGDKGAGYYCFAIAEFTMFDEKGDTLPLTAENYSTNAPDPTANPIENICDGNLSTFFHSRWSSGGADTGEHYLEIALPQPTYSLSFSYITRNLRTSPTEMVITAGTGSEEYDSIGFKKGDQVTAKSQLNTNDYYVLYGNLNRLGSEPTDGSGYYSDNINTGFVPNRFNLFRLESAGDTLYRIHFLLSDKYIAAPVGWTSVATTYDKTLAGKYCISESSNLKDAFKIYETAPLSSGDTARYYVLQDWGAKSNMCSHPIVSWDKDETDGESDWYIYKASFTADADSVHMLGVINRALAQRPYEGTNPGFYKDISAFTAALNSAVSLRYNGGTGEEYALAATNLTNVLDNLGACNEPEIGTTYLLVSAYTEFLKKQHFEKAIFASDSVTAGWDNLYAANIDSAKFMWTLVSADTANFVHLKNVATNNYMGTLELSTGQFVMSDNAACFSLVFLGKGEYGIKCIDAMKKGTKPDYSYIHAGGHQLGDGVSGVLVNWSTQVDNYSSWYLRKVEPLLTDLIEATPVSVIQTQYYTLQGEIVSSPSKGLYIVRNLYSNGSSQVKKIFIK